jgi:hypothetical protein
MGTDIDSEMTFASLFSMTAMFLLMAFSGFALEFRKDEAPPEA